jgi:hypothetical protein
MSTDSTDALLNTFRVAIEQIAEAVVARRFPELARPGDLRAVPDREPEPDLEQLLTAPQVAELLQVNVQRVYHLVRTKALTVVRINEREFRVDPHALRRFIDAGGIAHADAEGFDENLPVAVNH